jgi:hypothetical protein
MQHELLWNVLNRHGRRDGKRVVVLFSRLRPTLQHLNPDLPMEPSSGAVEKFSNGNPFRLFKRCSQA